MLPDDRLIVSDSDHATDMFYAVGMFVTVEPGLYYPEIGGVRLADVTLIQRQGSRNLTKFEKPLEV